MLKRITDIILAISCMILFLPLMILCYLAVLWEDGGYIFFKQERIGMGGKPFNIYKFRSMKRDAEKNGEALFQHENEKRMTEVGKFLRKHHLDELPQLWNVLKGDMSFVGYRPERQFYIDKIMARDPRYELLYQMRPGITSYATLYNGYTDTLEKMLVRLEMDLEYLQHHSWWLDMKILLLTFLNIVTGKKF